MADAVARSEQERRNRTADVAHELRRLLAALHAGLEELRDGLVPATPAGLAGLHDQSLRLGRVVSDLAELPAAESGGRADPRADVDLCQVARDELVARDSQLRAAGLVVDSLLDGPLWVRADADRLYGIGLAVAREIITAHGGTIAVVSPAGAGTTLTIELPLSPGAPRRT